jgi:hypothetical protein
VCWWKRRNWHPRQDQDLALVYQREKEQGNANRATLAVAWKMVAYLLAVNREQQEGGRLTAAGERNV